MTNLAARWQFRLYNTKGEEVAVFDNYISASITRTVNDVDTCALTFYDDGDERYNYFLTDFILIGQRSVPGLLNKYTEFVGLVRAAEYSLSDSGERTVTFTAFGLNDLLA
jgi:hypothetical protein